MGDKKNTMCSWKKEKLKENFDSFKKLVKNPKFACRNCGRVAVDGKFLCKPVDLD